MILDAARRSLANLFAPETRGVFWKVLGLTALVLVVLWFALRESFLAFAMPWLSAAMPDVPDWAGWLTFVIGIFASLGLALALALLLAPVTAIIAGFFLVNGYLLGREFFEFAAMRFRTPAEARLFRSKHSSTVFLAGLLIAGFLAIPIVNLLTPLFAAGLMVHLHKLVSRRDPTFPA